MSKIRESGENYLEAILKINKQFGEVRCIDLSKYFNISRASVSRAMNVLKSENMIIMEPYGDIKLTSEGFKRATEVSYKHNMIKNFLTDILKMEDAIAEIDACRVEHVVSDDFIESLNRILKNGEMDEKN